MKPNLLYIFPDQLGAQWLGCAGNPIVHSPHLDRFAEQSCTFNRAYSNSPVCTPYRGILFTGRYPTQTGVTQNGHALPPDGTYLPSHFNDAGYRTLYVGKWHLSGEPHCNRWVPPDRRAGFQDFVGWESHHVDHMQGLIWERPDRPILFEGHETEGLTGVALDRLQALHEADDTRPFCMFLSYQAPHPPCTPMPPFEDRYADRDLCPEPNTDRDAWIQHEFWNMDYGVNEFRRRYFSEITQIDTAFGRIMDYLDESGLARNTIVIFTSDHGEMNGCHGAFGKGLMFEESVKVPLMIRVPGREGQRIDAPVSTIDLFPSLLDLCGIAQVTDTEGRSFRPLLSGEAAEATDQPVFFEYDDWLGIMEGDLKLSLNRESLEPRSFYDLASDPFELHSLVGSSTVAENYARLRQNLLAHHERLKSASAVL